MAPAATPSTEGLYDSRYEHDACGVGFLADLSGRRGHDIVTRALTVLRNLEHRSAKGSDPETGDGAGILTQIPDEFFRSVCAFALPEPGAYAAGLMFLPGHGDQHGGSRGEDGGADDGGGEDGSGEDGSGLAQAMAVVERIAEREHLTVLGWRAVPHDPACCGAGARAALPQLCQLFVAGMAGETGLALDRLTFCLRKQAEQAAGVYFASLSSATIVYKGMLTPPQLEQFYPDLSDARYSSALALVHSRFSTNTFPSWPLAHPFRFVAHNGEINTIRGNRNWMRAREAMLATDLIRPDAEGRGIERLLPVLDETASDSASFDACLELLQLGGRSLPHALLMMIPEPWENNTQMDPARRAFYRFHASLMEPWDGPALIAFTDGTMIGAVLDRNGLRPGRYWVTSDGLVVLASEVGVLDIDPATVIRKGRLQPGRIFLADTASGRIIEDEEVKASLAAEHPYEDWLHAGLLHLDDLPDREGVQSGTGALRTQQQLFGYTEEELRVIIGPMARTGAEPTGSMGDDTPLAVLASRPQLVYDYFSQLFAQVTNPPLDAIREELVTSLGSSTGPEHNLFDPGPASCRQIVLPYPVISDSDLAKIIHINDDGDQRGFAVYVVDGRYQAAGGGPALRGRLAEVRAEVSAAISAGARLIVLSDRGSGRDSAGRGAADRGTGRDPAGRDSAGRDSAGRDSACRGPGGRDPGCAEPGAAEPGAAEPSGEDALAPIPSLLLTGTVHHHLIRAKTRAMTGLIVESGDARECHHIALLIGYGAAAVCPYLAVESAEDMVRRGALAGVTTRKAAANVIKALGKGVLKIMSKMGVSTVASYTGAQIFEAIGLGTDVIGECFAGTASRLGGIGFDVLAAETAARHARAFPPRGARPPHQELATGGEYQWRRDGEPHLFSPEAVFKLQHATRSKRSDVFAEYTQLVDRQSEQLMTLRGLLRIRGIDEPADGQRATRSMSHPWGQNPMDVTSIGSGAAAAAAAAARGGRGSVRGWAGPAGPGQRPRRGRGRRPGQRPRRCGRLRRSGRRCRWTRSSRWRASCAGSLPARCPTARSPPRRTRRWRSR